MASPNFVFVTETLFSTLPAITASTAVTFVLPTPSGRTGSSAGLSRFMTSSFSSSPPVATVATSSTDIPLLPSNFADPVSQHPKFNASSVTALYITISLLVLLLLLLFAYSVWAKCFGGGRCKCGAVCANCKDLQDKLNRWERGDIKRITKDMVKEREAYNNRIRSFGASASTAPAIDLEMGVLERESARAATLNALEGRPTRRGMPGATLLWGGMKSTFQNAVKGKGKEPFSPRSTAQPDTAADRFFTVETGSVSELTHQPLDTTFQGQPNQQLYQPTASDCSASIYSQSTNAAPDHHNHQIQPTPRLPAPAPCFLRTPPAQPQQTYSAYLAHTIGPRDQQRKILLAEGDLTSRAYKDAEVAMARDSIATADLNRHLAVVNRVDQEVQRARHPSRYSGKGGEESY